MSVRRVFTSIAPTIITGFAGFITLISFLLGMAYLRVPMVGIAVIVAAVAIVMGFFHLLYVHVQRIRHGKGAFYSIVLIVAALATLAVLIIGRISGDQRFASLIVFDGIIVSMQSALGALVAVFLALAAFRMVQRRRSVGAVLFLVSALVVLITQVPLPRDSFLVGVRTLFDAMTTGGMRGLLIGVALGTLATAFRVLFFIDRPQSE
jgi:hypothetical protein